jgi:glycosyltransferase involved in cell wall biosynthesis
MSVSITLGIPQVPHGKTYHPGGQLTAANGLVEFLTTRGIQFEVLNTVATVFPPVPLWKKLLQSVGRICNAWNLAGGGRTCGFITFSGFGLSLYERCCIALIYRIYRKPSVIFFRSSEILDRPVSSLKRKLLSLVLRIPFTVVTQGSLLADELRRLGCKNVEVIPNWLPVGYAITHLPKSYPTDGVVDFVFVGWLESMKGVPELLDAVAGLQRLTNYFRLTIVGNGSLEQEVRDSIVNRGLVNVVAPGWMDQAEVIGLLGRAHVFILPSHSEGFPNALLEAMANGLPVITTRVGAIADSVEQDINGLFVDIADANGIAASMCRYIEEVDLIPSHSVEAIKKVNLLHKRDINCGKLISLLNKSSNEY